MCTHLQFEVVHGEGVKEESVVDLLLLLTHIHSYHCSNRGILYKVHIVPTETNLLFQACRRQKKCKKFFNTFSHLACQGCEQLSSRELQLQGGSGPPE